MGELALRARRASILGIATLIVATAIGCSEDTEGMPDGSVGDGSTTDDGTVPPPDGGGDDTGTEPDAGDGGGNEPVTYEDVASILTSIRCASGGCHGQGGQAQLTLAGLDDIRTALVDVPACENNAMPRVAPGNPDNSWLMVKVGGHSTIGFDAEGSVNLQGTAPADGRAGCPLPPNSPYGAYGQRMPPPSIAPNGLSADEVSIIRRWIQQGAPGPT